MIKIRRTLILICTLCVTWFEAFAITPLRLADDINKEFVSATNIIEVRNDDDLNSALILAEDGTKIKFNSDILIKKQLVIDKSIEFDLDGHSLILDRANQALTNSEDKCISNTNTQESSASMIRKKPGVIATIRNGVIKLNMFGMGDRKFVSTQEEFLSAIRDQSVRNICLLNDIHMNSDVLINRDVNIDMAKHKLKFDEGRLIVGGISNAKYKVYDSEEFTKDYTNEIVNNADRVIKEQKFKKSKGSLFNRYKKFLKWSSDSDRKYSENEIRVFDSFMYFDDIAVTIQNGTIEGSKGEIVTKMKEKKGLGGTKGEDGNPAVEVISGNINLNNVNLIGGEGREGSKGSSAVSRWFWNKRAGNGGNGGRGGDALLIHSRATIRANNLITKGGKGGNGGEGGDNHLTNRQNLLGRDLTGKGGKGGQGGFGIGFYDYYKYGCINGGHSFLGLNGFNGQNGKTISLVN